MTVIAASSLFLETTLMQMGIDTRKMAKENLQMAQSPKLSRKNRIRNYTEYSVFLHQFYLSNLKKYQHRPNHLSFCWSTQDSASFPPSNLLIDTEDTPSAEQEVDTPDSNKKKEIGVKGPDVYIVDIFKASTQLGENT